MQVSDSNTKSPEKYIEAGDERNFSIGKEHYIKDYRVYSLSKKEIKNYFLLYGSLLGVCGYLFYKSFIIAGVFSFFSVFGLKYYKEILAEKRRETLRIELRDMLYSISASLSAGNSMKTALFEAQKTVSLIYGRNSVLARELTYMCRMIRETRGSEELLLLDFASRSCVEEVISFVDVYSTCRRTGGDINQVIVRASQMIVDKITIVREIKALTAQRKVEVRMLTVIPAGVLLLMQLAAPDYLDIMYSTLTGRLIMTGCLACMAISLLWSMKLTRIDV